MPFPSYNSPERSECLSSVYQNTGRDVPSRKLVFATDYHFQYLEVKYAEELLNEKLREHSIAINTSWERDDSVFILTCHQSEVSIVSNSFHTILRDILNNEETVKGEDLDELSEDEPVSGDDEDVEDTANETQKIVPISKFKKWCEAQASMEPLGENSAKFPTSINSYEVKKSWKCDTLLDEVANEYNLGEIGKLTRSHLVRDVSFDIVHIGSHSQVDCDLALQKLNNILKHLLLPAPRKHIFYSEEFEHYKISLNFLIDCKKRRFETTLLDNFLDLYQYLPYAVVARMVVLDLKRNIFVPHKEDKFKPAAENKGQVLRYWQNFTYVCHGKLDSIISSRQEHRQDLNANRSSEQVVEVQELQQVASVVATWVQDLLENPKVKASVTQSLNAENVESWDLYKEYGQDMPAERSTQAAHPSTSPTKDRAHILQENAIAHTSSAKDRNASSQVPSLCAVNHDSDPNVSTESQNMLGSTGQYSSLLDDDSMMKTFHYPSLLGSSSMEEELLIDFGDDDYIVDESKQATSEVSTRMFHSTMNQKGGKRGYKSQKSKKSTSPFIYRLETQSPPLPPSESNNQQPDPISDFRVQAASAFQEIMGKARGYRGSIEVQAVFSRMLLGDLPQRLVTRGDTLSSDFPDAVLKVINYAPATCSSTNVLTLIPEDVQFMIDVKLGERRMWEETPFALNVKYEFHISFGHSEELFVMEMEADSLQYNIVSKQDLGTLNVHGIKRRWDFAIEVTGSPVNLKSKHGELAEAIKKKFHVPEGSNSPLIHFQLPTSVNNTYSIDSLRVRRTCKFRNTTLDSILNVFEIYDLDVDSITKPDLEMFEAFAGPSERDPSEKLSCWYEAAITCPALEKKLQMNRSLELGEEASWNPKDFLEPNLLECYYLPACAMLKQMDGVGFYNNNKLDLELEPEPEESNKSTYQFW